MRLKLKPAIFSLFTLFLTGCVVPKKPVVDLCAVDFPRDEGVCASTQMNTEAYRLPLSEMDRYTCFSPQDWEAIKNYIDNLEAVLGEDHEALN